MARNGTLPTITGQMWRPGGIPQWLAELMDAENMRSRDEQTGYIDRATSELSRAPVYSPDDIAELQAQARANIMRGQGAARDAIAGEFAGRGMAGGGGAAMDIGADIAKRFMNAGQQQSQIEMGARSANVQRQDANAAQRANILSNVQVNPIDYSHWANTNASMNARPQTQGQQFKRNYGLSGISGTY